MDNTSTLRRYLPAGLWVLAGLAVFFLLRSWIAPYSDGISLNADVVVASIKQIGGFVLAVLVFLAVLEIYFYQIFFRKPSNAVNAVVVRFIQVVVAAIALMLLVVFLELTDLIRLGEGALGSFFRSPSTLFDGLKTALVNSQMVESGGATMAAGGIVVLVLLGLFGLIQALSEPRHSRLGLAYLLVLPAVVGMLFLIVYPFLYEIRLAFSNASLGTQATKNASYGLEYGWQNLVTLFTGNVAKDAKFFEVFVRTILWTGINVVFHVGGGMGLALLLNRPMKLQGLYRTLLVFPWAIPTTIAAMALRNEFDSKYGMFNIILGNIHNFVTSVPFLNWLSFIGPVSWKQDPFWAFISILLSNIWLGIPFMSVIILGGLQSISSEYYEAAEIDGANRFQMFRNITLPLLKPVLTPAVVLGVVWTFNKFDVIYLITQGGPQEKTDILVSSMYKAAFSFYRYGFTAMFALVIFIVLFLFTLFYMRITGGLKGATD